MIDDGDIREYQELYKKHYKIELSFDIAKEHLRALVTFYTACLPNQVFDSDLPEIEV